MFLNRLPQRLRHDERGAVLVAVICMMTVVMLLVTLITTSVVSGAGTSTASRSGVQSQAAAQAGVAAVRAIVDKSACTSASTYASAVGASPQYSVKVYWRADATGTWAAGCPANKQQQVKYVSTGTAAAKGVAGQSARDVSYVEAVYSASSVSSTITASGAAIYAYQASGSTGLGTNGIGLFDTLSGTPATGAIQVRHGNFTCTGLQVGMTINFIVPDGNFTQTGLCGSITGSVWAGGSVDMSGSISGNVSAGTTLRMSPTSSIGGNAWVRGASTFDNFLFRPTISGNLTTQSRTGNVTAGSTTILPAPGVSPYSTGTVADWVDYNYTGQAGWPGFTIVALPAGNCTWTMLSNARTTIGTAKGVIDARACTNGNFLNGISLSYQKNDLAYILPNTINVDIGGVSVQGSEYNVWFIQPDEVADGVPTCPPGGKITMSGVNVSFPHMMVYSPCTYAETGLLSVLSLLTFTGQIYAGKVELGQALIGVRSQNYLAIGLPGVDLTAGTTAATGPRLLLSSRNVQTG
jgi:Tfp pilus assembly protein PilX